MITACEADGELQAYAMPRVMQDECSWACRPEGEPEPKVDFGPSGSWDETPSVQLIVVIPEARRFLLPSVYAMHKNFGQHYPLDAITLTLVETAADPLQNISSRQPPVDYVYINSTCLAHTPAWGGADFCAAGNRRNAPECCPLPGEGRFEKRSGISTSRQNLPQPYVSGKKRARLSAGVAFVRRQRTFFVQVCASIHERGKRCWLQD